MKEMLKRIWDIKESFEDELRSQEKGWQIERLLQILNLKYLESKISKNASK